MRTLRAPFPLQSGTEGRDFLVNVNTLRLGRFEVVATSSNRKCSVVYRPSSFSFGRGIYLANAVEAGIIGYYR